MGYAFVDLERVRIEEAVVNLISRELALKHAVIPVKKVDSTLYVVLNNPTDLHAVDAVSLATECVVVPVLAVREAIEQALHRYYPGKTEG
jgi:type IV pilus assembly protein PilB